MCLYYLKGNVSRINMCRVVLPPSSYMPIRHAKELAIIICYKVPDPFTLFWLSLLIPHMEYKCRKLSVLFLYAIYFMQKSYIQSGNANRTFINHCANKCLNLLNFR